MAKKKKQEIKSEWGIFFLGLAIGIIIGLIFLAGLQSINKEQDRSEREKEIDDALGRLRYKEESKRLFNESGIPSESTCEQIKVMIQTDVYPPHILEYECKDSPEDEYSECAMSINYQTKDTFVKYYLLSCLEGKSSSEDV